jgi:hypothetical protein
VIPQVGGSRGGTGHSVGQVDYRPNLANPRNVKLTSFNGFGSNLSNHQFSENRSNVANQSNHAQFNNYCSINELVFSDIDSVENLHSYLKNLESQLVYKGLLSHGVIQERDLYSLYSKLIHHSRNLSLLNKLFRDLSDDGSSWDGMIREVNRRFNRQELLKLSIEKRKKNLSFTNTEQSIEDMLSELSELRRVINRGYANYLLGCQLFNSILEYVFSDMSFSLCCAGCLSTHSLWAVPDYANRSGHLILSRSSISNSLV